jgi:hypothetical protein
MILTKKRITAIKAAASIKALWQKTKSKRTKFSVIYKSGHICIMRLEDRRPEGVIVRGRWRPFNTK